MSVIFSPRKTRQYLIPNKPIEDLSKYPKSKGICIPIVIDCEYQSPNIEEFLSKKQQFELDLFGEKKEYPYRKLDGQRFGITTQIKGIHESDDTAKIFAHKELSDIVTPRHEVIKTEFHAIDWLKTKVENVRVYKKNNKTKAEKKKFPKCEIVMYAHFALAELFMVFEGEIKYEVKKFVEKSKITMGRRIVFKSQNGVNGVDSLKFPDYLISINGNVYELAFTFVDTCALQGNASYAKLCENTGIILDSKKLMDAHKTTMIVPYLEMPTEFDDYSKGDLHVYDALSRHAELMRDIYESLDILEYYKEPKLTIGSTVVDLLQARIAKLFDVKPGKEKDLIEWINKFASASHLRSNARNGSALLSKVRGGRCRNNRPTDTLLNGSLCDIDISGCYGEGQRNQIFPFGRPISEGLDLEDKNTYQKLGEWYKQRKTELIDGAWVAIISTDYLGDKSLPIEKRTDYKKLEYHQDFFESWFDFSIKDLRESLSDSDLQENEFLDPKSGTVKILNDVIVNGMLTSDGLDWILNICSTRQRKELLENLNVVAALYYPKSERVDSPEKLLEAIQNHENGATSVTKIEKGKSAVLTLNAPCHAWYGFNLGELLTDALLANRKRFPKKPTKHPMNEYYKLCVNTIYGVLVSPHFPISNTIVGNNITARARTLAWCMEKGFYGVSSITDGCTFDLNTVVFPKKGRRITASNVVNIHHLSKREFKDVNNLILAPLGGEKITIGDDWLFDEKGNVKNVSIFRGEETYSLKDFCDWIDKEAWKHLQSLFNLKVLHANSTDLVVETDTTTYKLLSVSKKEKVGQFSFETKSVYTRGTFHGSANYALWQGKKLSVNKMRSYTDREHAAIEFFGDSDDVSEYYYTDTYKSDSPAKTFLKSLVSYEEMTRQKTFIKQQILKPKAYKVSIEKYREANFLPGDNIYQVGLVREVSLSQFTFRDIEQYKSIEREYTTNKRRYEQSYERFFVDSTGKKLKYGEMILAVDLAISKIGLTSLNSHFNENAMGGWFENSHPYGRDLQKIRDEIYSKDETDIFSLLPVDDDDDCEWSATVERFDGVLDW
jgi:hypothetical protein